MAAAVWLWLEPCLVLSISWSSCCRIWIVRLQLRSNGLTLLSQLPAGFRQLQDLSFRAGMQLTDLTPAAEVVAVHLSHTTQAGSVQVAAAAAAATLCNTRASRQLHDLVM